MSACDCAAGQLQPVDQAIAALLSQVPPPVAEPVSIHACAGRVLAEVVRAPRPMPAWDNSAMDGYALRAADLPAEGGWLPLAGRIAAGDTRGQRLTDGHASRIFTGAPLPQGADTVVAQEQARVEGAGVWLEGAPLGSHVRRHGEEFVTGEPLLAAGQRLRPQDVGLLASLGIASVPVYRPLRVALLSSGNELRNPGEELAPGQIYNANYFWFFTDYRESHS
jgi:molybdopterin molybdotransferase